jgi:hypothetical protein
MTPIQYHDSQAGNPYHRHRMGSTMTWRQKKIRTIKRRRNNTIAKASRRANHGRLSTQRHK